MFYFFNNFFPSIAEYSTILENNGFTVSFATLFARPTQLEGQDGLKSWILMFRNGVLEKMPAEYHQEFLWQAEDFARKDLYNNGVWLADYVHLKMIATKK